MRRLGMGCLGMILLVLLLLTYALSGLPGSSATRAALGHTPLPLTPQGAIAGHGFCGENAVANAVRAPFENRVYGVRALGAPWGDVAIVGVDCPSQRLFGYVFVRRDTDIWRTEGYGTYPAPGPSQGGSLEHGFDPVGDGSAIAYGRVLAPGVVAVEATFADGRTVRDAVAGGVFAFGASDRAPICELRVLSAGGRVIERIRPVDTGPDATTPVAGC